MKRAAAGIRERVERAYEIIAASSNPVFIHLLPKEEVIAKAEAASGPLAALTFAVKDNFDVAGLPTTAACPSYTRTANSTARSVQRLLDAGAVLVGKTNMDQFATGLVGTRSPYGVCRNAVDDDFISGGSSSGSALAVALDMVDFSLGTDTAGSGRVPAAFNGIVGIKPTLGIVSTQGVVPACRSLDCVSVFAKTCAQAFSVLQTMREGEQDRDFDINHFRFAVPAQLEFYGDTQYADLFLRSLERLHEIGGSELRIDFSPFLEVQELLYGPWVAERTADLERYLPAMLPVTRGIIESGRRYSAVELFKAQHRLEELKQACVGDWDVLCVPGAPTIYRISEVQADPLALNARLGRYTNFVNLLDLAAITLPGGARQDGLPFGITLIGKAHTDAALAALGAKFTGGTVVRTARRGLQLAVVGAHLSGMPLNHQLTARGAKLVRRSRTAPKYRLYALDTKPGLVRGDRGASIELEVWEMPAPGFATFVSEVPPPLSIGTIELEDGEQVKGFLCEAYAAQGAQEITRFGGWRAYVKSKTSA